MNAIDVTITAQYLTGLFFVTAAVQHNDVRWCLQRSHYIQWIIHADHIDHGEHLLPLAGIDEQLQRGDRRGAKAGDAAGPGCFCHPHFCFCAVSYLHISDNDPPP